MVWVGVGREAGSCARLLQVGRKSIGNEWGLTDLKGCLYNGEEELLGEKRG